ncbi:MAG: DUF402 domain-containing protein [Bacilli bacterium]|nr:DUF402 domain-containing protein [Bacilli bacterium]MDD4733362.1 DUF402 domain-containing protein [Bacilli bacterium]
MEKIMTGEKFQIQCYKHNGNIHRAWDEATFLEETDEYLVFANYKTQVIRAEGISWKTKEPAIMYFFKKKWYNIIAQLKKDGIYYYCNIASPYIIEENTIKYIDYDLDLRVFPTGEYKILDKLEYEYHKKILNYSDDLDVIVRASLNNLIKDYKKKALMFDKDSNYKYYQQYKKIVNKKINN